MSTQSNIIEMTKSLQKLEESGIYDVEKYSYALLHQTSQLEYFYCHLVKDGDCDETYYRVHHRPRVHQMAYFNIGRGFPKELMDGHWCYVLKDLGKDGDCDETYYRVHHRPRVHQMAYFNIGRGFPKELMDGHWCYVLKDLGYKMLVIPCTSIKDDSTEANPQFEMDIQIKIHKHITKSRIQLSDIRSVDIQRLDLRKPFCKVLTPQKEIHEFVLKNLFE